MTRKALGRGLDALLPGPDLLSGEEISYIDVERILPNPYQPRTGVVEREDPDLEGLAESIRSNGVLEPLLARRVNGEVQLISGERRWRAARAAGLQRVPVIFKDIEEERMLEVALVENLQRRSLNPIEEAAAYQTLVQRMGLSQGEVAARVGRNRSVLANSLRLLKLPAEVRQEVAGGRISEGHAKVLLGLESEEKVLALARAVLEEGLSVRELEERVRPERPAASPRIRAGPASPDPHIRAAEEKLGEALCTRVRIVRGPRGRGRVLVHFHSEEELQRLYETMIGAASARCGGKEDR